MAEVTKIYKLSTIGFDQIMTELDQLAKKFVEVKKAKQDAAKTAADAAKNQGLESQAYKDAAKALDEQKIKELELKAAIKEKTNEAKAAQLVRQEEINQQKASLSGNEAEINSIKAIRAARTELNTAIIGTRVGAPVEFRGLVLPYQQANDTLKRLTDQSNAYARQFQKDGTLVGEYTTGIVRAFQKMGIGDLVSGQVTKANDSLKNLNNEFEHLKQELSSIRVTGQGNFENIERELINNRKEALALEQQIGHLNTSLRGTGDIGNQITTGLANGFKNLKGQIGNFILGYVGFQAAFAGIGKLVTENENLSDSIAQMQIYLKGSKVDADNLVESLKQINTRTSLSSLIDIGTVIAKKGVAKEEIAGVTKAVDDLMLTLGKEIGDPHEAVSSLVKLVNVYSEDKHVTAENIDRIGGAIARLTSSGVATGSFLINFAERLAGVRGLTGLTIDKVLGLGAALEELGQRTETSASSVSQLVVKIFSDVPKYAKLAGIEVQKFRDIITKDPVEGLLAFADAIKKNAKGAEEAAQAFGDANIRGQRAVLVFGDIAANAEYVRKRVGAATEAMNEHGIAAASAAIKQNTFAASVDRIKKSFEVAGADTGLAKFFSILGTTIEYVIKLFFAIPFGIVLTGLGLMTAAWAYYKGNVIAATLAQSANNEATLLGSVRLAIMRSGLAGTAAAEKARAIASAAAAAQRIAALEAEIVAELSAVSALEAKIAADGEQAIVLTAEIAARRAHVISLEAEVVAMRGATVATEGLNVATRASPLGIILTLVAIAIPALAVFGRGNEEAAKKVNALSDSLRVQGNIEASMRDQTTKTKNSVSELISIIKTEVDNQDLRKKAYQELIRIAPEFRDTLDAEFNATGKLIEVYDKYILQLDKVSRAQAIRTLKQKYDNDLAEKQNNEFQAKIAADEEARQNKVTEASNKNIAVEGLSSSSLGASGAAFVKIQKVQTEKQEAYKKATEEAKKARDAAKSFTDFMRTASDEDKQALIEGTGDAGSSTAAATAGGDIGLEELKKQLASVNGQIAEMDRIRVKTKVQMTQLKDLRKQRSDLLKQIKELGGSVSAPKADTLSAGDKDRISIEDTTRDLLLTLEKKKRVTNQEDEETYLKNVLKINQDSIDRKLTLIKGEGIAEKKLRAQLSLDRITEEQDTISKIQELHNKEFSERQTVLKNQLDQDIAAIKEANDVIQSDTDALPSTKAQARVNADNQILALVQKYNTNIDTLEKQLNANTVKNSKDLINLQVSTKKDALSAAQDLDVSILADIDKTTAEAIAKIKLRYDQLREDILKSKDNQGVKNTNLQTVDNAENLAVGSTVLGSAAKKKAAAQDLFDAGLITAEQFQAIFDAANAAQKNLNDTIEKTKQKYTDLRSLITGKLSTLFKFDVDTEGGKAKAELLSQTLSQAYSVAQSAMDNYYAAEAAQIERSRTNNEKALQLEFDQKKSKAQSQAEQESLDKQFQARKEANDRDAFEKNKKIQREQAKVNLAIQLSNLAVIAFSPNPANIATLGIAGTIMYAIQAALALANYALNVGRINSAQFAFGGEVPKRGGKFGGKAHTHGGTKFQFQGEQYEAEVDELAIIRTRNAPARNKIFQIAGTHQQIASQLNVLGGGIQFAPGAKLKRFEAGGALGATLQAPVFIPSSNSSVINNNNAELIAEIRGLRTDQRKTADEQSRRIDRIKVAVNAHEIRKVSNQIDKAAKVGTL